jgi:ferrous iron transport protein A
VPKAISSLPIEWQLIHINFEKSQYEAQDSLHCVVFQTFPMPTADLNSLAPGASAIIVDLAVDEHLHRRLKALGLQTGEEISMIRKAWLSGPLHVRIGNTELIVRRSDAQAIKIRHTNDQL